SVWVHPDEIESSCNAGSEMFARLTDGEAYGLDS
ncbi:hypothetical protein NPIL_234591, partial [Nephila pilipes]